MTKDIKYLHRAYWPYIYFLQRNIHLCPLSSYDLGCFCWYLLVRSSLYSLNIILSSATQYFPLLCSPSLSVWYPMMHRSDSVGCWAGFHQMTQCFSVFLSYLSLSTKKRRCHLKSQQASWRRLSR